MEVPEIAGSSRGSFDWVLNVHRCTVTMLLAVRIAFKGKGQVFINCSQYTDYNYSESSDPKRVTHHWIRSMKWNQSLLQFQHYPCRCHLCSRLLAQHYTGAALCPQDPSVTPLGGVPALNEMKGLSKKFVISLFRHIVNKLRHCVWCSTKGTTVPQSLEFRADLSTSTWSQVGILHLILPWLSRSMGKVFILTNLWLISPFPHHLISLSPLFPRLLLQYSPDLHVWTPAEFPQLGATKQVLQMLA